MEEFVLFGLTFVVVYLFYQLFLIVPSKRAFQGGIKNKNGKKELLEIRYLKARYPLDFSKISYLQLLQICGLISSLDISISVSIISYIDNFFLEILIGFVVVCMLIFISYHLVYLFYRKKGMIKNGKC